MNDIHALQRLFYPRSVVLIGASDRSPWSQMIAGNFQVFGYTGEIFAVNKRAAEAHGLRAYGSCQDLPHIPDAAFIFVPLEAVLEAIEDAGSAGIKAAVILTSGFAETGPEGAALQQSLLDTAAKFDMVCLGPNCLGYANVTARTPMTPIPAILPLLPGTVSLVSQSGATNSEIVEFAHQNSVGISLSIATGNEARIDIAACVDFLVQDDNTKVVMVFAETIRDTATFAVAAKRALAKQKPIVILKVGTSELTAQVAAAHTGSLVGDDNVFDAACKQLGVIRTFSIEEMVTVAALLAYTGPLAKPGVGLVSISGGACTLFADRADAHGVELPAFAPETKRRLLELLPSLPGTLNPLDITGAAIRDGSLFTKSIPIIGDDPNVGFVGCIYNLPWNDQFTRTSNILDQLKSIGAGLSEVDQPGALIVQTGKPVNDMSRQILRDSNIPAVFGGIDDFTLAFARASSWSARVRGAKPECPAPASARSTAHPDSERAVLEYLAGYGIPVVPFFLAHSAGEAADYARSLNSPVALKVASPDIAHKTDIGGVKLNLDGDAAIMAGFEAISAAVNVATPKARIDGILVSPMRQNGLEILVGTVRDAQWGPVLAVGLGGIWVEALADTQIRLLPVTPADVKSMLTSLRAAKVLGGLRGMPAVNIDKLANVIARIGDAALALGPHLATLEVNPLWVRGGDIEALDGLAVWENATTAPAR